MNKELIRIRETKKYKKYEMADFIGCDRKTYRKYEATPQNYPAWKIEGIIALAKKAPKK